jgi:Rod binding domain-containing protein
MSESIALPGAPLPMPTLLREGAPAELRRVAEEFEAIFLAEMLSPMFDGLETDGLGGGGLGEQIFRPMLVERYAEAISRAGGVGIADSIVRELVRMQENTRTEGPDGLDR